MEDWSDEEERRSFSGVLIPSAIGLCRHSTRHDMTIRHDDLVHDVPEGPRQLHLETKISGSTLKGGPA